MKLFALLSAGALAAGTVVAAAPADAQHYGRDGYHRGYGHGGGYGYRGGGYRGGYGYRHGYYGRGHGWRGGYRAHVRCRVFPGRYHPVRRCY